MAHVLSHVLAWLILEIIAFNALLVRGSLKAHIMLFLYVDNLKHDICLFTAA